jgi:hypothetical protein
VRDGASFHRQFGKGVQSMVLNRTALGVFGPTLRAAARMLRAHGSDMDTTTLLIGFYNSLRSVARAVLRS